MDTITTTLLKVAFENNMLSEGVLVGYLVDQMVDNGTQYFTAEEILGKLIIDL